MKTMRRYLAALLCVVSLLAAFSGIASADYWSLESGWLNYAYGGYVYIPKSFRTNGSGTWTGNGYHYDYWNSAQQMSITLTETDVTGRRGADVIDSEYSCYTRALPKATYDVKTRDAFVLSGYLGDTIYYVRAWLAHDTLYEIRFDYPTRNRKVCDPIVEEVEGSFSAYGSQYSPVPCSGKPSSADLDLIRADIKYPNYQFMYLDHYEYATVSHREVYVFKDPDTDVWRRGNYFTVGYGTEVTILAKSMGYACVIFNATNRAGWINLDYLWIR